MSEPSKYSSYKGTTSGAYKNVGKGNTEDGYTDKMKKNILGAERSIRDNMHETVIVFDPRGNEVGRKRGTKNQVDPSGIKVPTDAIITHNHPSGAGQTGIKRIGSSFSSADIGTAIRNNVKEIRAVTSAYTFSVKRPKGGWGDRKAIVDRFKTLDEEYKAKNYKWLDDTRDYKVYNARVDRLNVTHTHMIMKQLAKEFGLKYSRKRG